MKLLDYAWSLVTSVGQRDHESLRLLLDGDLVQPVLAGDPKGYVLKIPTPRTVKGGFYTLHGLYFDPDERGWASMWRNFKASLYHGSLHAAYSDFKIYSPWARGKDRATATYAVSLLEDFRVTLMGVERWPGIAGDIAYANYMSSLRIPDPSRIESRSTRFAAKLLLAVWGVNRARGEERGEDGELELLASSIRSFVRESLKKEVQAGAKILFDAAEGVYSSVAKVGLLKQVPCLPYMETHGECDIFDNKIVSTDDSGQLLSGAWDALGVKPSDADERVSLEEAREFYQNEGEAEERLAKTREHYEELLATTHLESVEFPKGDYGGFLRIRSSLWGPIKNVRDQLRLVKNVLDETQGHDSGQIDTQQAMQVIASGNMRNDVFVREEPIIKSEAWAILVDASKSTSTFTHEIKGITTCLAEVAKDLIPVRGNWGLFTFNSSLQVIKDFNEVYGIESRARIGGITQRDATYLPDAMHVLHHALANIPVDTRIMVVASDGYPTGYQGIETKLISTIKEITKSGVLLIGIGIDSHAIEDYFTVNCMLSNPYQMMKSFVKSYLELSSMF